jgi:hypothetical protein
MFKILYTGITIAAIWTLSADTIWVPSRAHANMAVIVRDFAKRKQTTRALTDDEYHFSK